MITIAIVSWCLPFTFALMLTRLMVRFAPRVGLVDHPEARKFHTNSTPLGGGVAIYLAITLTLGTVAICAWLVESNASIARHMPEPVVVHAGGILSSLPLLGSLIGASTLQMLIGLADDVRTGGIAWQIRLGVEIVLVGALAFFGIRLSLFTDWWAITVPVTIVWVVGLTNSLNMLDNMDALSGGVACLSSAFFAIICYLIGDLFIFGCFLILTGALTGFLRYNWHPAKIFMGDAGSNFIGFFLGVLTVSATFHNEHFSHVTIFAPLCILAVPIYDSTSVITLRLIQGKSPFQPDKQHFSHRLVELGLRPKNAVLLIYLVTITTGLSGLLLYYIPPGAATLILAQVGCLLGIIALLEIAAHRRVRSVEMANK